MGRKGIKKKRVPYGINDNDSEVNAGVWFVHEEKCLLVSYEEQIQKPNITNTCNAHTEKKREN